MKKYLLQVFGPVRRLRHGHEATVGQDGAHDEQTEQREQVKEQQGLTSQTVTKQRHLCPNKQLDLLKHLRVICLSISTNISDLSE